MYLILMYLHYQMNNLWIHLTQVLTLFDIPLNINEMLSHTVDILMNYWIKERKKTINFVKASINSKHYYTNQLFLYSVSLRVLHNNNLSRDDCLYLIFLKFAIQNIQKPSPRKREQQIIIKLHFYHHHFNFIYAFCLLVSERSPQGSRLKSIGIWKAFLKLPLMWMWQRLLMCISIRIGIKWNTYSYYYIIADAIKIKIAISVAACVTICASSCEYGVLRIYLKYIHVPIPSIVSFGIYHSQVSFYIYNGIF